MHHGAETEGELMEIELETTYLAKEIPEGVLDAPSKEVIDLFIPKSADHPHLRIRKNGDTYEITDKRPVEDDKTVMRELTIPLSEEQFGDLVQAPGKRASKVRYFWKKDGFTYEFNVYQEALQGLVVVEVEFPDEASKNAFVMPDFCLADVSQEEFVAGGYLAGRSYEDIQEKLASFGYEKL